jgi:hypothetical protein
MKLEAFFTIPLDADSKTPKDRAFKAHLEEIILPNVYQMPFVERVEMTSFSETPEALQKQFIDQPLLYQVSIYIQNGDKIQEMFETEAGKKLRAHLREISNYVVPAWGPIKVFYNWDLQQIR